MSVIIEMSKCITSKLNTKQKQLGAVKKGTAKLIIYKVMDFTWAAITLSKICGGIVKFN